MIKNAYVHIPFCIRKCNYCSFVSGINISRKEQYIDVLIQEIKNNYKKEELETLYFGGGTPSLLSENDIEKIISLFNLNKNAEITLEVNPETVEKEKFKKIKNIGINRISLGIQTFDNSILKLIGRNHDEQNIYNAVEIIKNSGFDNISIDLIYGLPNQTKEIFEQDITKAINLDIQHISTYGLKIEENSFFYKNMPSNLPDDEQQAEMFLFLCDLLKENNFIHYEISNFTKKGFESKHNCSYWKNKNYYGFGLNASGYENNIRYKNQSNFEKYLLNPLKKEEIIKLTNQEIMEDEIFLALRLENGINIDEINEKYNINFEDKYKEIINKYQKLDLLKIENRHCKLTKQGILLSNEVMSEFID